MLLLRCGTFALGLALVFSVATAGADDKPARPDKGKLQERLAQLKNLLPADVVDKLKLTDEQKEKLAKLQKEFEEKLPEAIGKAKDAIKAAIDNKDRDAMKKAIEEVREGTEKLRKEFLDKVNSMLTEEQKKKLEELRKEAAVPRRKPNQ